ncbi:TPA: 3-phosphoglycerate dehydrogenase [Burkholderia cenocepacia]|uniref:3-phosphoglycerate dehydrogenase n=1 Tax=unclassified Burkholderia TaxID=2613784 RepID=UPI00158A3332|nr:MULTISPECIES: 3-phosphoglycerate dehydrogenase [unclassified Burkholderia]HEF5874471.1 3-phosphoglycerate dehydrogenase [Burkholderia cenocepacia]
MNITISDDYRKPDRQPIHEVRPDASEREAAALEPLILDLLEWIGRGARPYDEVIDAWRTSCPRLPVWEEACARGYVVRRHTPGGVAEVAVSAAGRAHLRAGRT